MQEKVFIMCSWWGWGYVQQGGDSASLDTAYAAFRPRDGFSHPYQEHMKDLVFYSDCFLYLCERSREIDFEPCINLNV